MSSYTYKLFGTNTNQFAQRRKPLGLDHGSRCFSCSYGIYRNPWHLAHILSASPVNFMLKDKLQSLVDGEVRAEEEDTWRLEKPGCVATKDVSVSVCIFLTVEGALVGDA
jgi:hypothetical protein